MWPSFPRLPLKSLTSLAAYAGLVAAAALVVVLGLQNRALREELSELRVQAERAYPGLAVPTFRAVTLAGDSVTIGKTSDGRRQLLFIFNTTCGFCRRTIPVWKGIASKLGGAASEVEIFGISTDGEAVTREYASREGVGFPVLRFPEAKLARLYRVVGVPLTLVVDHEGQVVYARGGSLERPAAVDSIFQAAAGESETGSTALRQTVR